MNRTVNHDGPYLLRTGVTEAYGTQIRRKIIRDRTQKKNSYINSNDCFMINENLNVYLNAE